MTGLEIITQAWEVAGEATDLAPTTVAGKAKLVAAFNGEVPSVIGYKQRFRQLRTRAYRTRKIFKYVDYEGTIDTGGVSADGETITLASISGFPTDITEALVKDSNGEVRLIYDYSADDLEILLDEAFTTTPVATDTLTIFPAYIDMDEDLGVTRFVEVLSVEDAVKKQKLERRTQYDTNARWSRTLSRPRSWWREGSKIWLNTPPDEDEVFKARIFYERMPDLWVDGTPSVPATDTGSDIDLPQHFHQGVVWRLVWWIYHFRQEPDSAQAALGTFQKYMDSLRMPDDYWNEMNKGFGNNSQVRISQPGRF